MNTFFPKRIYEYDDVPGCNRYDGQNGSDPDAEVAKDIRGDLWRYQPNVYRRYDAYSHPAVTDHLLRQVLALHQEISQSRRDVSLTQLGHTGIVLNGAPRVDEDKHTNGRPFYLAKAGPIGEVHVVSYLDRLSAIRNQIHQLSVLPNEDNGVYPNDTQFRSSHILRVLLDPSVRLKSVDPSSIPVYDRPPHLAYADRFGNAILFGFDGEIASRGETVRVRLGDVVKDVLVVEDLNHTEPGILNAYGNEGNKDIVFGWGESDTAEERLEKSAWRQLGSQKIGTPVSFQKKKREV